MNIETIRLGTGTLTRVGYLDIPVPAELLGLSATAVAALSWAAPTWAQDDQPLLGNAAWFADLDGQRLVFDPLQTLDVVLRPDPDTERTHQEAVTRLFADAGFPVESVDQVVMTHIDGVGMAARHDGNGNWAPFFPNARILMSDVELSGFRSAGPSDPSAGDMVRTAWTALMDAGHVQSYRHGEQIAPGLVADVSGGHGPGHAVLHFREGSETVFSLIGHLAVTPVQLATGECAALNEDPAAAWKLLHENAADGHLIGGSLWPTPGYGRWLDDRLHPGASS